MHTHPQDRENRVRLDDVLVELSTGSPDEAFEADVVNIGPGGLAVRSPLLPEIGSKLRCSFASPLDGSAIHAQCEVVWAADQGPNLGEFGLRFERLSGESAESLRRIVESDDRMLSASEASDLGWAPPPATESSIIGLALDGVSSELVAEAVHDSRDVLVAEQELPFLRIGTGVTTESGRRGVLQSVELRVDDELPRLVLTVVYDSETESSDELDALLAEPPKVVREPARAVSWLDEGEPDASDEADDAYSPASDDADESRAPDARFADGYDDGYDEVDDETSADHDTIPDDVEPSMRDDAIELRAAKARPRTTASRVREVGEPVLAKASDVASAVKDATSDRLATAIPAVRDGLDRARQSATAVAENVGSSALEGMKASFARVARFASLLVDKTRAESPDAAARPKRVQRRPDQAGVTPQKGQAAATSSIKGRHVLVGSLAVVVLALAARGVWNAPDEPSATPPAAPAPAEGTLDISAAPPAAAPVLAAAVPAATTPPPVPTVSTPTFAAGPMPTPTYPSALGGEAPTQAVVAQAPRVMHFGAASVPGATPFELRMNMAIDSIAGESASDGFTVHISRSTSATRAGPIAEQHPDVEQASVTNQGTDSVLRIRFKPGRHPAYRVEANGDRLRILIGR